MTFRISGCVALKGLFAGKPRSCRDFTAPAGARLAREGVIGNATNHGYSSTALICRRFRSIHPRSIAPHSRIR
ncbi:hypothetical protein C1X35_02370 [Pseudomonas sp. FW306-1C-G01A]|nr:hypothetical protein C1X56_05095 [Pseudomonas sp. GW101-1A09]PMV97210.1 hypothetical protein C1X51_05260 [Pseudomonas sp. FW306-2-2C-B10A]PMW01024.1 hypothetical protein C1X55_08120 [Pseudomonas sp. GW460-C8]PMW07987.1 hypothetical protein C1X50_02675 [Pseudomonas sp. MPR-TSA4]PMW25659.1 hypothetical protein C1X40_00055 [Pseudomonas sp. GW456-11-11-14-TSB2]PMW26979.1 hypothetical protein C1X53_01230 [Pseudomonas sp. GW456-E6]PMW43373.1 hypothetical protein C1X45_01635 [Pseudomonas sp. GW46